MRKMRLQSLVNSKPGFKIILHIILLLDLSTAEAQGTGGGQNILFSMVICYEASPYISQIKEKLSLQESQT